MPPPTLWHNCFFLLFAAIACASAVAVVVTGNIVRMACWLVVALAAVAGLFFLAGAAFLASVQLMVYVGGTMVLLIFGVMLTARGPFVSLKISSGQWVVAIFIAGALLAVLLRAAMNVGGAPPGAAPQEPAAAAAAAPTLPPWPPETKPPQGAPETKPPEMPLSATQQIGLSLLGVPVDRPQPPERPIGGYLLAFEIISIHLVVVLVGAAYLARAKRRVQRQPAEPVETSPY